MPAGTAPLREVVHYGRNSLATLHDFEKRFCLPETGSDELWGYNEHAIRGLIGPGYFVARQTSPYEVTIDYAKLPPTKPRRGQRSSPIRRALAASSTMEPAMSCAP